MTDFQIFKRPFEGSKETLSGNKGNMIWYLAASLAGIAIFYFVFFLLWGHIKGWFIHGS